MKIYAAKVEQVSENILNLLDKDRQQKVKSKKRESERNRSACAGLLLRYAFLKEGYSVQDWNDIIIKVGEFGKPVIVMRNGLYFQYSLSHSGEYVVCAVDSSETGIDIQEKKPDKLAIAKRFYSGTEYDRLITSDDKERDFYRMWTAKEAYAKYTGRGIGAGLDKIVVNEEFSRIVDEKQQDEALIQLYENIEGYIVCACSRDKTFPKNIDMVSDQLFV